MRPGQAARRPATPASLAGLVLARLARDGLERIGAALWQRRLTGTPGRILFAPETLLECDAGRAADIYAGVFCIAGETVDVAGRSPFAVAPPSQEWARGLHGFGWLVHLEANASPLSSSNARALLEEWLASRSSNARIANEPRVVADRLTAWLVESPLLLSGADTLFRLTFMRAVGRHMRRLERLAGRLPHSIDKVHVAAALALAGTVVADETRLQRWALAVLADTLAVQVLPDGGHVSRSPEAVAQMLTALIPLREALVRRQQAVPPGVRGPIDRLLPMLRFFTHRDGTLAGFHGAGAVPRQRVDAIAAYDDVKGKASGNARYSGFQRLEAGDAVAILDTGPAPPPAFAAEACASALAFEFSHGLSRVIVNCGALGRVRPAWSEAGRATAAHSTLTLADRSSARVLGLWPLDAALGPVLYGGPHTVDVTREGLAARAAHDGYRAAFGVVHERTLKLAEDGLWLDGIDRILGRERLAGAAFAVRFHLAPGIRVRVDKMRRNAMLRLSDGSVFVFAVDEGPALTVEESLAVAGPRRVRRTAQIVVAGNTLTDDIVRWHIARHAAPLGGADGAEDEAA